GNEKQIYYYKCAYSRCNYVAAREKKSHELITNILGIDATLSFDSLPLLVKKVESEIPESLYKEKYVCLSGAVNYNKENSSFIAGEILKKYKNHKLVYLVGSPSGMNNEEPDVIESLKKFMPELIIHDAKSFTEWLSVIKNSVVLISGRYHYSIAAMCFGTPTVCFSSNTPKLDEINKMFNLPGCVRTHDEFTKALNEIDNLTWQPLSKEMSDLAEYNYNFL
ncbi:polysaccharide pyruvyl transferase family protein, partial [Salmonella enterica]